MYPLHAATRNSKDILSNVSPTLPQEIQRISRQMRPHSATWILHGIYGSVIAEAGKKHYDSDVHKRG